MTDAWRVAGTLSIAAGVLSTFILVRTFFDVGIASPLFAIVAAYSSLVHLIADNIFSPLFEVALIWLDRIFGLRAELRPGWQHVIIATIGYSSSVVWTHRYARASFHSLNADDASPVAYLVHVASILAVVWVMFLFSVIDLGPKGEFFLLSEIFSPIILLLGLTLMQFLAARDLWRAGKQLKSAPIMQIYRRAGWLMIAIPVGTFLFVIMNAGLVSLEKP